MEWMKLSGDGLHQYLNEYKALWRCAVKVYGTIPSFSYLILGLCVKNPMFIVAEEDQQKLYFSVLNPDKTLHILQKSNV